MSFAQDWCAPSTVLAEVKSLRDQGRGQLRAWLSAAGAYTRSGRSPGEHTDLAGPHLLWRGEAQAAEQPSVRPPTAPGSPLLLARSLALFFFFYLPFVRHSVCTSYQAGKFHELCDGHAHTLVAIVNDHGHVFGGYSGSAPWRSTGPSRSASAGAFLFLLEGRDPRAPLLLPLRDPSDEHALVTVGGWGPCFGGGRDLSVYDSMTATGANSCFPGSYGPPEGACDDTTLGGAARWAVARIEVWQL
jgi:hypothetical protein